MINTQTLKTALSGDDERSSGRAQRAFSNFQSSENLLSGDDERGSGRVQPQQHILLDDAELRSLGACDAAFGDAIAYNHPAYLEGYLQELKRRPVDGQGRIIYATAANTPTARWTVAADSSEF